MATPTGTELFSEESKNVIGIMHDTPNPTNINPTTIKAGCTKMIATKKPADKSNELSLMMLISPNLAINLSPQNRPINMAIK